MQSGTFRPLPERCSSRRAWPLSVIKCRNIPSSFSPCVFAPLGACAFVFVFALAFAEVCRWAVLAPASGCAGWRVMTKSATILALGHKLLLTSSWRGSQLAGVSKAQAVVAGHGWSRTFLAAAAVLSKKVQMPVPLLGFWGAWLTTPWVLGLPRVNTRGL